MLESFRAIVPAGGAGTRLWPLSRAGSPKFRHDLTGTGRTLLQATVDRLALHDDVHFTGPGVNRRTGRTFRGRARWSVRLAAGTYRYRSGSRPRAAPRWPERCRRPPPGSAAC